MLDPAASKREQLLRRLRRYFSKERTPRFVMFMILGLTAGTGFLCSRWMLGNGLTNMGVRYLLCTLLAWGVFIVVTRVWVAVEQRFVPTPESLEQMEGGEDEPEDNSWSQAGEVAKAPFKLGDAEGCFHGFDVAWILLAVIAVLALATGIFFGVITLVATAPALLAEAVLDVLVAGAFARHLRLHDTQWWAFGIIRRTWKIAIPLAVTLCVAGLALQAWKPWIRSLGELL